MSQYLRALPLFGQFSFGLKEVVFIHALLAPHHFFILIYVIANIFINSHAPVAKKSDKEKAQNQYYDIIQL